MNNYWESRSVVLLGGANIIGTHLAEALIAKNVKNLSIIDNLSAGKYENIQHLVKEGMEFYRFDLRTFGNVFSAVKNNDIVFHLAAQHGGRGFVASHELALWNNLELDTTIFRACEIAEVEKVVFSSSACAYPNFLQRSKYDNIRLRENMIDYEHIEQADGPYGTEKLIGEMMLDAYIKGGKFKGCSTRSYTVYGPLMGETHAIAAFIAKSMIKQDPFEIWGENREIIRNWTFVEDNVQGALLAAEHIDRGAINIGIEDRLFPEDALEIIWEYIGWRPKVLMYDGTKPTGPINRVADATKLKELGWRPSVTFKEGLKKTVDWYYETHNEEDVRKDFERKLTEI